MFFLGGLQSGLPSPDVLSVLDELLSDVLSVLDELLSDDVVFDEELSELSELSELPELVLVIDEDELLSDDVVLDEELSVLSELPELVLDIDGSVLFSSSGGRAVFDGGSDVDPVGGPLGYPPPEEGGPVG